MSGVVANLQRIIDNLTADGNNESLQGGPKVQPAITGENECPKHRRAARCHHRGGAWIVEYRYKNGHWTLETHDRSGWSRISLDHPPSVTYADRKWEWNLQLLREIEP